MKRATFIQYFGVTNVMFVMMGMQALFSLHAWAQAPLHYLAQRPPILRTTHRLIEYARWGAWARAFKYVYA